MTHVARRKCGTAAPTVSPSRRCTARAGFTLIELLVVIGIIVVLISILLPAAAAVRKRAYATSTTNEIDTIAASCQAYYQDYHSYPGPISENDIDLTNGTTVSTNSPTAIGTFPLMDNGSATAAQVYQITSSENLILGLTGGLNLTFSTATPPAVMAFNYTPSIITQGQGPQSLSILINSQKQTFAYFTPKPEELPGIIGTDYPTFGSYDSQIPEYLDHIPGNVIGSTNTNFNYGPILYMRARVGATGMLYEGAAGSVNNGSGGTVYQYNFNQVASYGFVLANINTTDYPLPSTNPPTGTTVTYDYPMTYFANPGLAGQPKGKDSFILISAGSDRMFGTKDDIIYGN